MSDGILNQLARAVYEAGATAATVSRLRQAAAATSNVHELLSVAADYPTSEEVVEVLAKRAIELDSTSEQAWETLAAAYSLYDGPWLRERTRSAVEKLLALNQRNLVGLRLCLLHAFVCRDLESVRSIAEQMLAVDPLNFSGTSALAKLRAHNGDFAGALALIDTFIERMNRSGRSDAAESLDLIRLRREAIMRGDALNDVWP
jgi:uncharacterized membrane-anchored protein